MKSHLTPLIYLPLLGTLIIAGCMMGSTGSNPSSTPAQIIYQVEGGELEALALANQYRRLPTCPVGAPLCKTNEGVQSLRDADAAVAATLATAEAAVRDPTQADAPAALRAAQAAQAALQAFVLVTSKLKVK